MSDFVDGVELIYHQSFTSIKEYTFNLKLDR